MLIVVNGQLGIDSNNSLCYSRDLTQNSDLLAEYHHDLVCLRVVAQASGILSIEPETNGPPRSARPDTPYYPYYPSQTLFADPAGRILSFTQMAAPLNPAPARGSRSLLLIAILAGMAAAAAIVLIQAMHSVSAAAPSNTTRPSTPYKRPSAFGAVIASGATPGVKGSPAEIARLFNRSVVTVTGYDAGEQPTSQGVGYVYSSSGIIVTSYDAIRQASSVTVESSSGDELSVIAVMGYSTTQDLAVLAVLEGNLPALESGASEIVQEGDAVTLPGENNAVVRGAVGARRAVGGVDLIQITAAAAAGSPVLNESGKVIAMVTGRQMAIPSRYVSDLLAEHRVLSFDQILHETHPDGL